MAYLVLARKWRSHIFEDVCGQEHITKTLSNAIQNNRVGHAYLFTGPRGVGKTSIARIFAKKIREKDISSPEHIKTLENDIDILEIDGASHTGVDAIRDLRETVSYRPTIGKYKIYIIDEVHMLSTSAFNALLKTLEEPPSHVVFIFATTEPHKLPYTILSRCQRFDFKRITPSDMAPYLESVCKKETIHISQKNILKLCQVADGSLRDALSILDQIIAYGGQNISQEILTETLGLIPKSLVYKTLQALIEKNISQCLNIINEVYHYGHDLYHFSSELLESLRLIIISKLSFKNPSTMDNLIPIDEKEKLTTLAKQSSEEELIQMFHILLQGVEEISRSSFPKYALELTLIKMTTTFSIQSIQNILDAVPQIQTLKPIQKESFLVALKKQKPLLSAFLQNCEWEKVSENEMNIKMKANEIGKEELATSQTKKILEDLSLEFFKKEMTFNFTVTQEKSEVLHPKEELKQEALKNETVKKAQSIFEGTIQNVRTFE
ncbi:MAG: DNA polymerase III subunit gamma/tau [Deltaproteobacteria bacterium]|nr:DNA polymerase III subunit gamma/tau [Deltaproteobacteria bacterium]